MIQSSIQRSLLAILFSLLALTLRAADASALVDKVVAKISTYPSVQASYAITADGHTNKGTIRMSGRCFSIASPAMSVWYDGKTQWTYLVSEREVDITEPTAGEVRQVNPFAIMQSFKSTFTTTELKSTEPGKRVIQFKPKNPRGADGISKAVMTIGAQSLLPEKLVLTMTSGATVSITISGISSAGKLAATSFRPQLSALKNVEIVDLR